MCVCVQPLKDLAGSRGGAASSYFHSFLGTGRVGAISKMPCVRIVLNYQPLKRGGGKKNGMERSAGRFVLAKQLKVHARRARTRPSVRLRLHFVLTCCYFLSRGDPADGCSNSPLSWNCTQANQLTWEKELLPDRNTATLPSGRFLCPPGRRISRPFPRLTPSRFSNGASGEGNVFLLAPRSVGGGNS